MAVRKIFWSGARGEDLHVVDGAESMDLRSLLAIDDSVAGLVFASTAIAGVAVRFEPHFHHAPVLGVADTVGNFGVEVNTLSGKVKVVAAAPRIRSFLIEAIVTDASVVPAQSFSVFIRACAHGGIERIWLTPSELHLHKDANGQRLTLLAEFTDGRTGMINNVPALAWATSDAAKVAVNAGTGKLDILAAASNATITVTLPAAYQVGPVSASPSSTATVHCLPAWSTARRAKLIVGSAGVGRRNEVRNFVFLPDGFVAGEEALFDKTALTFAKFMRQSPTSLPFGLCRDRLNFWTVWVESQERGTSVVTPVVPRAGDRSEHVPDPTVAAAPAQPGSVEELILRAGYPSAGDRNVALGTQTTEWDALYGAGFSANITAAIHNGWRKLADFRQLDERNTAFGLASGGWPNAQDGKAARGLGLHPFRTTRAHLDLMLPALDDDASGTALGDLWGAGKASRPHVVFISFGGPNSGARSPNSESISVGIEEDTSPRIAKTGPGLRAKLKPFAFPKTISLDARTTVSHESAHSFGLMDEYGGGRDFPASLANSIKDALNCQPASTTATAGLPGIDPAKLKWHMPRIERAAVLVQAPTVDPGTGDVEAIVMAGQAVDFQVGDLVRFRQRPLLPTSKVSIELEVTAFPGSVAAGDQLQLRPAPPGGVTPGDFPGVVDAVSPAAPSIVFMQKSVGGAALNLLAPEVAAHLATTGVALNTAFGTAAAGYVCAPDTAEWHSHWIVQRGTNIPSRPPNPGKAHKPKRPTQTAWIVGAYEGGSGFHCGVLHPTGACLMRRLELPAKFKTKSAAQAYQFCVACAYAIVDALDPSKHGALDRDYIEDRHYVP